MSTTAKTRAPQAARDAWKWAMRNLPDVPAKVETNPQGQIILSPASLEHSDYQSDLLLRLHDLMSPQSGQTRVEWAVETGEGTLVPDVIWISSERRSGFPEGATTSPMAPELCIEVMSPGNTDEEMTRKRRAYFEAGAEEVWIVSVDGDIRFYSSDGPMEHSRLAPDFPSSI